MALPSSWSLARFLLGLLFVNVRAIPFIESVKRGSEVIKPRSGSSLLANSRHTFLHVCRASLRVKCFPVRSLIIENIHSTSSVVSEQGFFTIPCVLLHFILSMPVVRAYTVSLVQSIDLSVHQEKVRTRANRAHTRARAHFRLDTKAKLQS